MKKIIKILLCVAIIFTAAGCSGSDISGEYELVDVTSTGDDSDTVTSGFALLKALGMEVTMTLNKDGTGVIDILGQTINITYDKSKKAISFQQGGELHYTYKDNTLTIAEEEGSLVFKKK